MIEYNERVVIRENDGKDCKSEKKNCTIQYNDQLLFMLLKLKAQESLIVSDNL